jgi:diguanylate cyclase (GGDEF)-like protein
MYPTQARLGIAALMGPAAVVFFLPGFGLWPAGVVLAVYFIYLMGTLRQSAKEFDRQIAMEIDLINQRAEIGRLSLTDALTGLPNRRSYEVAWSQAWQGAVRQGLPLALLVFDLDYFKRINDTFGHLGGDACLRHFAGLLGQIFPRRSDFIARIGGEEFVAILPNTAAAAAQAKAEALRQTLAATPCGHEGAEIAMTVSVGFGMVDTKVDAGPDATFCRIDGACYEAKRAGRNRVVTA